MPRVTRHSSPRFCGNTRSRAPHCSARHRAVFATGQLAALYSDDAVQRSGGKKYAVFSPSAHGCSADGEGEKPPSSRPSAGAVLRGLTLKRRENPGFLKKFQKNQKFFHFRVTFCPRKTVYIIERIQRVENISGPLISRVRCRGGRVRKSGTCSGRCITLSPFAAALLFQCGGASRAPFVRFRFFAGAEDGRGGAQALDIPRVLV